MAGQVGNVVEAAETDASEPVRNESRQAVSRFAAGNALVSEVHWFC